LIQEQIDSAENGELSKIFSSTLIMLEDNEKHKCVLEAFKVGNVRKIEKIHSNYLKYSLSDPWGNN
jgi:hypothetical protein